MRPLLFIFCISFSFFCFSQNKVDAIANQYILFGDSLTKALKYDSGIIYYKKAIPLFEKRSLFQKQAFCLNKISENYLALSNLKLALKYSEKALQLCKTRLSQSNIEEAAAYETLGSIKINLGEYDKAMEYFLRALKIVKESHPRTPQLYRKIGNAYNLIGDYGKALDYFQKSLIVGRQALGEKHQEVAYAYNNIAGYYYNEGDFIKALEYLKKALALRKEIFGEHHPEISASYTNMGTLYKEIGDYSESIEYHQRALNIRKSFNSKYLEEGVAYNNLGIVYHEKGDYELAMEYYEKALAIQIMKSGEKHPLNAGFYYNIGLLHADKGEFESALKYYRKALDIQLDISGEKHPDITDYYNAIGIVYLHQKDYAESLKYQQKALKIQQEIFGESHMKVAASYTNLADIYIKMGNYSNAIIYQKKSLSIKKEIYKEKNPTVASAYFSLGESYYLQKEYDKALEYFHKSVVANSAFFVDSNPYILPPLKDCLDENVLLRALERKGRVLFKKFTEDKNLENLKSAIKTFDWADKLSDKIRQSHLNHNDKVELGKTASIIYEGAITSCLSMYKITNKKSFLHKAYYYCEKSKAGALKEALLEADAKQFGKIPQPLLSLEKDLKLKKSFYQSRIQEEKSSGSGYDTMRVHQYEDILFLTNRTYDSLILSFEKNYPSYHKLKYQNKIKNVSEIQQELDNETVMVEYFVGDSTIYVFTITADDFRYHLIKKDKRLSQSISELRLLLNPKNAYTNPSSVYLKFVNISHFVYKHYLQNALIDLNKKEKLIIIPDGELGYVPFDILLTRPVNPSIIDYKSLPYLLNDFNTRYAYSASLLLEENQSGEDNKTKYIAFAPSYESKEISRVKATSLGKFRDQVTSLSWNKPEVTNISKYIKGVTFKGNEAIENKFKRLADKYNIIHLAMHALIDDEKPMNSKLVFANVPDSLEDGFLHAYEIYNMQLPADMVVLSACETGYGKLEKGEGIMSLARAFSYAGCPSIVMSHWVVDDESTAKLMELFYKYLAEGMEKDKALRLAKMDYLNTADALNQPPAFWASFVVLGDASPIKTNTFFEKYWVVMFLILLVLSLVLILKYKKQSLSER